MEAFGLKADTMGSVSAIRRAKDQLAVLLNSQVGHRVDAAIEAGASIQMMQDATSLLHRDGKSIMAMKLRIAWPEHSGKLPWTETLTAGVQETRSGSAEHEKLALFEVSENIAFSMPDDPDGDHLHPHRIVLCANTRISDTASTATKVNAEIGKDRILWMVNTAAYKAADGAKQKQMLASIDIDCVSHGVQNSGLVIPKAMDAAAAAMVGFVLILN
jgi:hypothetical protein